MEKVNIPILLVHGTLDSVVHLSQATRLDQALDAHEKDYRYLEIEDLGHSWEVLEPKKRTGIFSEMLRFLSDDCESAGTK